MAIYKMGAHNCATGEEGSFWSKVLTPFARCQSKTLVEQYNAGVRLFDVRVRVYNDELYCYHGLWRSEKNVYDLLRPLLLACKEPTYFEITYEGGMPDAEEMAKMRTLAKWINLASSESVTIRINRKTPWEALETFYPLEYKGDGVGFLGIHGRRCLLPIPWLWKKIHGNVKFNDKVFIYTDYV